MPNIIEVAVANGSFTTLATALTEAGLIETLQGAGPFTVFAPNDEAFAKIDADTLAAVLADKDKLTAILTYHVVAGKHMASEVVGMSEVTTLQGGTAAISTEGGASIGGAKIIATDVEADNGVIHVIDTVLMPS
jgi:uncharacterized surface protein with fasciclin (FAS1) repeats